MLLTGSLLPGCQCGGDNLVHVGGNSDGGVDAGAGGGTATGGGGGGGVATGGSGGGTTAPWCASDCDCPMDQTCVSSGGELASNSCQPATTASPNSCLASCPGGCPSGYQCVQGTCTLAPCVGSNCTGSFSTSVAGTYQTYYEFDVSEFAKNAADVNSVITLISQALSGNVSCTTQTTSVGQLECVIVKLIAANIHAPPWVSDLLNVLSGAFQFGNQPVRARGVMQVAENSQGQLYGAETLSELWVSFSGQSLNLINSPQLGTNGQISVTVKAFGGTRTATQVSFGPRAIEFDVNQLLVNIINVFISAASNGVDHNIGDLLDTILCDNVPANDPATMAICRQAAAALAQNFQLPIGLGGLDITQQTATIYDFDMNGVADAFGTTTDKGQATGSMTNGLVDGAFGAFPKTWWYGTK
jgi:hypothetical protein